jgi:hypothetical protein
MKTTTRRTSMTTYRSDLEPWQRMFHDDWEREQGRRNASVPDYGDWHLYGDGDDEDDDEE